MAVVIDDGLVYVLLGHRDVHSNLFIVKNEKFNEVVMLFSIFLLFEFFGWSLSGTPAYFLDNLLLQRDFPPLPRPTKLVLAFQSRVWLQFELRDFYALLSYFLFLGGPWCGSGPLVFLFDPGRQRKESFGR